MPSMQQVVFLYKGDEPGSVALRNVLDDLLLPLNVRLWSDKRAADAGFNAELVEELGRADAIVHCIGPKGPGFYQSLNEIRKTADAMASRADRRLVVVLLADASVPAEFSTLHAFADRTTEVRLNADAPDARTVVRAAVPNASPLPDTEIGQLANEIIETTLNGSPPRSLTIVVGPYAFAESTNPGSTPAMTILKLLRNQNLPGFVPWLDVMGSLARARASNDDICANEVARAISAVSAGGDYLCLYLRLLAANWARSAGNERLYIVTCEPDSRIDMALRSAATPVPHLRLVNRPREKLAKDRLLAQRIVVRNSRAEETDIAPNQLRLDPADRVVLIKPLGCLMKDPAKALLTAEHWRASSSEAMDLPGDVAQKMRRSCLLVLGAGVFSPSLQIVFSSLLRGALEYKDDNDNRFMIHNQAARVKDPLHRAEAALLSKSQPADRRKFDVWLLRTYGLQLRLFPPLALLAYLDHQLNENYSGATQA